MRGDEFRQVDAADLLLALDEHRHPHGKGTGVCAQGGDVRMVYSPLDALALARANPARQVVFFGLGFETTMPATALTVQQAELSQAMATGVVESYMSSGSTGYDTKTYEHLKFFADTQAWLPKNIVFVSKKAFDALDQPARDALLKKGLVYACERGRVAFTVPHFGRYLRTQAV